MSREVVIVEAVRTPIGRFLGTLKSIPATRLGSIAVKEVVKRANLQPSMVDEVIMGQVVAAGAGQNPARQAALHAGLPNEVAALTINKVCGSGLKAVVLGAQAVALGDAEIVVAGGMESMSCCPYLLDSAREGYRMGNGQIIDSMILDGLWCAFNDFHMGNTGEIVAEEYNVSRQDQDEYAYNSQRKAVAAIDAGNFKDEIVPVVIPQRKGDPITFDTDEGPRRETTLDTLAKLKPVFKKDGTVTAGNAPGVNDGASAVVIMSSDKAKELGLTPMARIVSYATSGIEPRLVMMAPVEAVRKVWKKTGLGADDFDLYELNEAFSVQAVACVRELGINPERVNVNGGAVALGHPIGATGAVILTKLLYAMRKRNAARGIASLCLGGGNAVAMAIETI